MQQARSNSRLSVGLRRLGTYIRVILHVMQGLNISQAHIVASKYLKLPFESTALNFDLVGRSCSVQCMANYCEDIAKF